MSGCLQRRTSLHGEAAACRAGSCCGTAGPRHPGAQFRYALLVLDLLSIGWIVVASFLPISPLVLTVDCVLGVVLLAEFAARQSASARPWHSLVQPLELADLLGILSLLLAPLLYGALGFLRVLRTLRLLHSVRLVASLRSDLPFFRRNEEATLAAAQLGVFVFIMTGLVFETQHRGNPHITNYADALYFTVTALTTTGFGDITLQGQLGRLLRSSSCWRGSRCSCGWRRRCSGRTRCASPARAAACNGMRRMRCTARPAARCCASRTKAMARTQAVRPIRRGTSSNEAGKFCYELRLCFHSRARSMLSATVSCFSIGQS